MTIDLDAIEAAARAATPGEWRRIGTTVYALWTVRGDECNRVTIGAHVDRSAPETAEQVCHHIATMDPQTTLALVERVRGLEAMESRLHETLADYEYLRRSYAETGDNVRAEMFADRIAQIETAMRRY